MSTVHMMIGIPGSGKSTYCKNILLKQHENAVYVASDVVRDNNPLLKEEDIWPEIYRLCSETIKNCKDLIYDATNITPKVRKRFVDIMKEKGATNYDIIAYYFPVDYKICEKRVERRNLDPKERYLPVDVIEGYGERIIKPTLEEGFKEIIFIEQEQK